MALPKVRKQTTFILSAIVLVAIAVMIYVTTVKKKVLLPVDFEKEIQALQEQSTSDEITAIEKDVLETDLINLDRELKDIEKEINQAYY